MVPSYRDSNETPFSSLVVRVTGVTRGDGTEEGKGEEGQRGDEGGIEEGELLRTGGTTSKAL